MAVSVIVSLCCIYTADIAFSLGLGCGDFCVALTGVLGGFEWWLWRLYGGLAVALNGLS